MTDVVKFPALKLVPQEASTPEVNPELVKMLESLIEEAKRGDIIAAAVSTVTAGYSVEYQLCDSNYNDAAHELMSGTALMLRGIQEDFSSMMVEVEQGEN